MFLSKYIPREHINFAGSSANVAYSYGGLEREHCGYGADDVVVALKVLYFPSVNICFILYNSVWFIRGK